MRQQAVAAHLLGGRVPEEDKASKELIENLAEAQRHIATLEAGQAAAQEQQRLIEAQAAELARLHEALRQERFARAQAEIRIQLSQSQKMQALSQLAGGVAHHFNNMLTAIIGFVSLARETLPDHHPAVSDLERVLNITHQAANLTRQLLIFTRTQPVQLKIIQLNTLIQGLVDKLQQTGGEAVHLVIRLAPDLDLVRIDAGQLLQLLMNVVANAREAMPAGGELIVETANVVMPFPELATPDTVPMGEYIRLSVIDTGVGMTEETIAHIFEPFFTTKEVGQGVGLGLSACFGIIRQHGGYITVQSIPGQGSVFNFYFPRLQRDMDLLPEVGSGSYGPTRRYQLQCYR